MWSQLSVLLLYDTVSLTTALTVLQVFAAHCKPQHKMSVSLHTLLKITQHTHTQGTLCSRSGCDWLVAELQLNRTKLQFGQQCSSHSGCNTPKHVIFIIVMRVGDGGKTPRGRHFNYRGQRVHLQRQINAMLKE